MAFGNEKAELHWCGDWYVSEKGAENRAEVVREWFEACVGDAAEASMAFSLGDRFRAGTGPHPVGEVGYSTHGWF